MNYRLPSSVGLALCTLLAGLNCHAAEDWPHWRGLQRNGHVDEPSGWNGGEWPQRPAAWRAKFGAGGSGPIVIGKRLYTMGWENDQDHVYCVDVESGEVLWTSSYPCPNYGRHSEGDKGLYSGPSSCPSFDTATSYLFTLSADGDLNCWDTATGGKRVWGINFHEKYRVPQRPRVGRRLLRDYGYTSAPLVVGDLVIVEVGSEQGNLMAFSSKTGQRQWASQSTDPAGHTGGAVPILVDGLPCVVVLTIRNLLVVRIDPGHEGETLGEFPWVTDFANNIAAPTVFNNSVIITSEYNQYSIARVDITRQGAKQVWKKPYASGVSSPIVHKGYIYWCWRAVYCLDFETGKPMWRGGRNFGDAASCIATADDRLIIWGRRGDLILAETAERSPKKYTELSRQDQILKNDVWPHVVLAGGKLFCKDRDGNMICFQVRP